MAFFLEIKSIHNIEVYIGGGAALFAILAGIYRAALNDFSQDAVLEALISISELIVSALVLLVAIRSIVRNMGRKDSFDNVLKQEIDNWVNRNRPLISEDQDFSNGTRYFMLTDHEHIFDIGKDLSDENSYKKGQFVIIPNPFGKNDQLTFILNKSTFLDRAKVNETKVEAELKILASKIAACINSNFGQYFAASADKNQPKINVILLDDFSLPEQARSLVKMIDYVMTLYMVDA